MEKERNKKVEDRHKKKGGGKDIGQTGEAWKGR